MSHHREKGLLSPTRLILLWCINVVPFYIRWSTRLVQSYHSSGRVTTDTGWQVGTSYMQCCDDQHCVEIVQTRSYFWSVFSCIGTEYRKIQTRNNSHFPRSALLKNQLLLNGYFKLWELCSTYRCERWNVVLNVRLMSGYI